VLAVARKLSRVASVVANRAGRFKNSHWDKIIPKPKLPYTESFHEQKNGGWPEMHQGSKHSAFKGAYWKAYRGDRLHNWFIARADVANFTKSDIILNGILNVHYFNSYQLR